MTIVLHIGLPKTGSSALQYGFEQNRQALADAGVHYALGAVSALAATGGITSGNGGPLVRFLVPGKRGSNFDVDAFPTTFQRAYGASTLPVTLISSEALSFADGDMLRRFSDEIVRDRPLIVVACVRDLYGHARSGWMQGIKRHATTRSFEEMARRLARPPQVVQLRTFAEAIGVERMRVLHYESERSDLFAAVARTLGLALPSIDTRLPAINRSLSGVEVEVLRACNMAHQDAAFSRLISDRLIERHPDRPSLSEVDETVLTMFGKRFAGDVAWVNETFFGGREVLGVGGGSRHATTAGDASPDEVWREVVEVLADEIKSSGRLSTNARR